MWHDFTLARRKFLLIFIINKPFWSKYSSNMSIWGSPYLIARRSIVTLFALICCAFLINPAYANDNFPGTTITGNTGSIAANNNIATGQAGEAASLGGGTINSIWYSWTAPSNGTLTVQTCGGTSNFDTTLQIYTGATLAGLTAIANNDDSCGTQSLSTFAVTTGTVYRIQVEGYASNVGNYTLSWAFTPSTTTDLSLGLTVLSSTPPTATATGTVTYRLSATNAAAAGVNATGVVVGGAFPNTLIYVSDTGGGAYTPATQSWNVGALNIGQTKTIDVTFLVMAQGATITSTAEITAQGQTDFDSTPNNGVTTEDDYATVNFTPAVRNAGTPPAIACPVGSTTFDWGVNTWAVGSTNNSYNLAGVGNFNIAMTSTTAYSAGSPAITNQLTGGVAGEVSLFQNLDNNALSDTATTVITMPGGLPGVQFKVFDVDYFTNQFADRVVVTGSYQGSPVVPTLTNSSSNYVNGNVAIGDLGAADATANGTVTVTFNAPIDTITIVYGNHTTAPANPGNQWIGLSDITFCNPYNALTTTKISSIISDGVSATNPKSIPGAIVRYCITVNNAGGVAVSTVNANDTLPADVTYVAGSLATGTTCANASNVEDDNAIGADETDPFGMSITGTTINGRANTIAANSSFAMVFHATID